MYLLDNRRCPKKCFYFSGLFMVKLWHFPYLKSHSTYEIYHFLKITALFTCLIVSYTFESNNSERKMKFCFFSILLQVLNWWRLSDFLDDISPNLWKMNISFDILLILEHLPSIIVQRTKKIIRIIFGFWVPICPKID